MFSGIEEGKEKPKLDWTIEATWRIVYGSMEDFSSPTEVGMERNLLERRKFNGPSAQCNDIFGILNWGKMILAKNNNVWTSIPVSLCLHVTYTYKMYIYLHGILNVRFLHQISH